MIWFLDHPQRLQHERDEIALLLDTADWLQSAVWEIQEGLLSVNATLFVHDKDYEVTLIFPDLFPEVPAYVRPTSKNEIWSVHQYLNGTLCLEWGPDTWHPAVTGAQLLRSAFRLLDIEGTEHRENNSVISPIVPSRHQLSLGQELRSHYSRVFLSNKLQNRLNDIQPSTLVLFDFTLVVGDDSCLFFPFMLKFDSDERWKEDTIPTALIKDNNHSGVFYFSTLEAQILNDLSDLDGLRLLFNDDMNQVIEGSFRESRLTLFIIRSLEGSFHAYWTVASTEDSQKLHSATIIGHSEDDSPTKRLPVQYDQVHKKRVGIVGLGSLGSKIAFHLGRTGIKQFCFIDDDIFFPSNIARHVLDWRNVGEHKVEAIKKELSYINNEMHISSAIFNVGGQESSSLLSQKLSQLGQCDIIIDATANVVVFNILAAVAKHYEKPLVWAEVFAGGIGGFVGRSRPRIDPDAHSMRQIYYSFTVDNSSAELPQVAQEYWGVIEESMPLQATDADVSVIAAHCGRLVLDTLSNEAPSIFPYSMYLIGLQSAWVFNAPFHTIPLSTDEYVKKQVQENETSENQQDEIDIEFLETLLRRQCDNNISASKD
jgi:sulfur-carrier protein adenylyltransferase/sulfurtransferase